MQNAKPRRTSRDWLPWSLLAATIVFTAAGLVLLALSWTTPVPDSWGFRGFPAIFAVTFATVGALIAARRRENPIGWILLAAGLLSGVQVFGEEYAIYAVLERPGLLGGLVAAWFVSWSWVLTVILVATFLLLLFPDGRLRSPRWRPIAALSAFAPLPMVSALMFSPGPLNNAPYAENPVALPGWPTFAEAAVIASAPLVVAVFASALSLVLRFRDARGIERQQLKWLAYAASAVPVAFVVASATSNPTTATIEKPAQVLLIATMELLPIAVGITVLRYRLYDIDLLINRTLVYGALTALLAATYFGSIVLLQALFRPLTQGSELAVAASTLAAAALAQPLRRRVQRFIDRRFYRRKYDAEKTVGAFSARLRHEVDLDSLAGELLLVTRESMQPTVVSLWLLREGADAASPVTISGRPSPIKEPR